MRKQLNISIDEKLIDQLKKERHLRNRTVSNMVETILINYYKEQGVNFDI